MDILFDRLLSIKVIRWQRILEDFHIMSSFLKKMILLVSDGLTKEHCIAAYLFCKQVHKMVKRSGFLHCALYLKQCASSLQIAYGGDGLPLGRLPLCVSLTRCGYPRIIPSFHRRYIYRRDDRADLLVQIYLSFFSLARLVPLAPKVSKKTFESIISPCRDIDEVRSVVGDLKGSLPDLISRYAPHAVSIPLHQGLSWQPTWKSLPTHKLMIHYINEGRRAVKQAEVRFRSCFPALLYEMSSFTFLIEFIHSRGEQNSSGLLWPVFTRYAADPYNKIISGITTDLFDRIIGPKLPSYRQLELPPIVGRLGQTLEGGAKRRIFAIGNYINQRLLAPVHTWLMAVLGGLATDGTFNQTKPFDRLAGEAVLYSYDLKSATDRWPLLVMFEVLCHLFDRNFASSVVNSALACNIFEVPFVKRKHSSVSFVTGQPLGYLSSWPLFALSHHIILWWSAELVYPGKRFLKYAILGDDVVIADEAVAKSYRESLRRLGVDVSDQKSLISHRGAAEFAKRFRVRNMRKDISPRSMKALKSFVHPYGLLGLHFKYGFKRVSTLLRVGGIGYRALANYSASDSVFIKRLLVMFNKPSSSSPFANCEWWFGKGLPLNPYLKGRLVREARKALLPKDLKPAPEEFFVTPKVADFMEYTMLRSWMQQWLRYLLWYCTVVLSCDASLDSLFAGPEVTSTYYASRKDPELIRFGFLWKLYDLCTTLGLNYSVPILDSSITPSGARILGRGPYRGFLVCVAGLTQPRPGKGLIVLDGQSPYTTIRYKTLRVADRTVLLDYDRLLRQEVETSPSGGGAV